MIGLTGAVDMVMVVVLLVQDTQFVGQRCARISRFSNLVAENLNRGAECEVPQYMSNNPSTCCIIVTMRQNRDKVPPIPPSFPRLKATIPVILRGLEKQKSGEDAGVANQTVAMLLSSMLLHCWVPVG
jgi:hypothetical protein